MADVPLIDSRTAPDIERETRELLLRFIREDAGWPGHPCTEVESSGALAALIAIFGRFAEKTIVRINRSPERNFLAFLDLLGVSRLHPLPARVPLTFSLATGTTHAVVVKAGTQAAAQPAKNEKEPSIFETERELVVSPVRLVAAYMMDHNHDRYYSWLPQSDARPSVLDSQDASPVQHILYLGFGEALAAPARSELEMRIALEKPVPGKRTVVWEIRTAESWVALQPSADETDNLSRSGAIRFTAPPAAPFTVNVTEADSERPLSIESRWIRARLTTPLEGKIAVPRICSIGLQVGGGKADLPQTVAFWESQALDLTRDFLPFGARPTFGSALYLGNAEAVSVADAEVTIQVELTNPAAGGPEPPIPRTTASGAPQLAWEIWNGTRWNIFGISQASAAKTAQYPQFEDSTMAFTQTGQVKFRLPQPARAIAVNGKSLPWIRVRLISGDYGTEVVLLPQPPGEQPIARARLAPPSIHAIQFDYHIARTVDRPERILDWNDFKWKDQSSYTGCFEPFRSDKNLPVAVYFGFDPPGGKESLFGKRSLSLHILVKATAAETTGGVPSIECEYWSGKGWNKWTVRDETGALTDSGSVRFLPPPGFSQRTLFDRKLYWLRARWTGDGPQVAPIRRILMNTVMAVNAETVTGEILGSGNGKSGQILRTLRSPVLDRPVIQVLEPQRPSVAERARIEEDEGDDAVTIIPGELGAWIRWHEVSDFLESGPFDRHYVMDHIKGEISFGDSSHGMIPPSGAGNIRASSYRTGGGAQGNRKAGEIVSPKTTVPYVDQVCNYEPAEGGVDAEDESALPVRGPNVLRHRNRAVTRTDYEDLAMLATPEVARAKCLADTDLMGHQERTLILPGAVSVVVVPRTTDAKPVPNPTLLDTVRDYLNDRKVPTAELYVLGPDYVRVEVDVEIGLDSLDAGDIELAVTMELNRYLHPLTGGPQNTGWQFGRRVRASELYKVIEPVPGVGYISLLEVKELEEPWGATLTKKFLIYPGIHKVRLFLPGS